MRVEQVPLLMLVQDLNGGDEDSRGGGEVGGLLKRYSSQRALQEVRRDQRSPTLRVCFSNSSSLSSASWILPACRKKEVSSATTLRKLYQLTSASDSTTGRI